LARFQVVVSGRDAAVKASPTFSKTGFTWPNKCRTIKSRFASANAPLPSVGRAGQGIGCQGRRARRHEVCVPVPRLLFRRAQRLIPRIYRERIRHVATHRNIGTQSAGSAYTDQLRFAFLCARRAFGARRLFGAAAFIAAWAPCTKSRMSSGLASAYSASHSRRRLLGSTVTNVGDGIRKGRPRILACETW